MDFFLGGGGDKGQLSGMKELAVEIEFGAWFVDFWTSIHIVPEDWMVNGGKMDADLMGASGFDANVGEGTGERVLEVLFGGVMCEGVAASHSSRNADFLAVFFVAVEGRFDAAFFGGEVAGN